VLYLTPNPNRASSNVALEGWIRVLRPKGLTPVLVSDRAGAFHSWALGQGVRAAVVPLPLPRKSRPWSFLRSLAALWLLAGRERVQLIHCNEQAVYPIGQYLGRLRGVPCVVSVRSRIERGFGRWAFGGARRPRRIFFLSRPFLELCRPAVEGIVPAPDWRVLPNALDPQEFRPDDERRARFRTAHGLGDGPLVGTASALRPVKQIEHLFAAVSRLEAPGVRPLLAGAGVPGGEAYAEELVALGRRMLGPRLCYLGHLDDLRDFLNALDLFVNTAREEPFGVSVLQALACGTPVVGYPRTTVAEVVLPGGGEIVAQDDVDALARALDSWLADPARLASARAGARHRVESSYDVRAVAEQLWAEYQSVLR
jgi:glycosyltransferase involved in cell wall biosynthesis